MYHFFIEKEEHYHPNSVIHNFLLTNESIYQIKFLEEFDVPKKDILMLEHPNYTLKVFELKYSNETMQVFELINKSSGCSLFYSPNAFDIKKQLCIEKKFPYLIQIFIHHDQGGSYISNMIKIDKIENVKEEDFEETTEFFSTIFDLDICNLTIFNRKQEDYLNYSSLNKDKLKEKLSADFSLNDKFSSSEEEMVISKFLENRLLIEKFDEF